MVGADGSQQLEAVDIREHDVQHREVVVVSDDLLRRLSAGVAQRDLKALVAKIDTHQVSDGLLVIHDEDMRRVHAHSFRRPHYAGAPWEPQQVHVPLRHI